MKQASVQLEKFEVTQSVRELAESDSLVVRQLLVRYPLESVFLLGLVDDHGICSPKLRGRFFGWFRNNELAAIALLGHQIMFCGDTAAIPAFAKTVIETKAKGFLIFGPSPEVEQFGQLLSAYGRDSHSVRELCWYVCEMTVPTNTSHLQKATPEHLEAIFNVQGEMHFETTGVDPRLVDPIGFRERVSARIERGRTWIKLIENQIVFKAELQSVTPTAIYLEGIWTHPNFRGQNIAKECVAELTQQRLLQKQTICLAVEPEENIARHIYEYAGFTWKGDYQARYLNPVAE
jgi:uncharacterized protein